MKNIIVLLAAALVISAQAQTAPVTGTATASPATPGAPNMSPGPPPANPLPAGQNSQLSPLQPGTPLTPLAAAAARNQFAVTNQPASINGMNLSEAAALLANLQGQIDQALPLLGALAQAHAEANGNRPVQRSISQRQQVGLNLSRDLSVNAGVNASVAPVGTVIGQSLPPTGAANGTTPRVVNRVGSDAVNTDAQTLQLLLTLRNDLQEARALLDVLNGANGTMTGDSSFTNGVLVVPAER